MEVQIKKTIKAGNSSAVVLPRAWLNKEVRVELINKSKNTILLETLNILEKNIPVEDIIGIYLVGSYAREEDDKTSDIDLLVITNNADKEIIREGIYNILIISQELLNQKLENDLFPIAQMIKEAKPLINSHYLGSIDITITKKNIKWYLKTTLEKLRLIEKVLNNLKNKNINQIDNKVIYTLILRIRTLYIIENLIKKKIYSKKEFIKLIKKISKGNNAYESYLYVKNDSNKNKKSTIENAQRLYNYLKKQLRDIKKLIEKSVNH